MKKLIIANWKLNPTSLKEVQKMTSQIENSRRNTVVVCPPHIFLSSIKVKNLGAQDCFFEDKGPYTGHSPSALQLKNMKVKFCLVGHSEVRKNGETSEDINKKIKSLLQNQIVPVLCIGFGTKVEQDELEVVEILNRQVSEALFEVGDVSPVVVAYEPVWAISSGSNSIGHKTPSPEHVEHIAMILKMKFGLQKVLYGGSSNYANAASYLQQENVDGLLIGGDSLIVSHFNQIISL